MSTLTTTTTEFRAAVDRIRSGSPLLDEAEALLDRLTPDERLWLLDGDKDFWVGLAEMAQGYNIGPIVMGEISRLGIPGLRFSDGPRGVVMGNSTAFPVSMARGATWDVDLEERIGHAIGLEVRAQGGNLFGGVCINLPRHPAWGRAQETYGEDPLLLGEFGAALVRGVTPNAMAVAKHFALNSMENARFKVDVTIDDAALHEVYLPHFRRAVEDGAAGIMTSYNSVNGEWAGQNEQLMEGVLRGEWGFEGVTVSDFIFGLRDAAKSLRAGLDVEEPFRQQRAAQLPADLVEGRASWEEVDRAARRILSTQLRFYASAAEADPSPDVVFSAGHRRLAREAAAEAVVLLKNEPVDGAPVLPLAASELASIALVGRLATIANTGDHGSSDVHSPAVVTPIDGLRAALPNTRIDVALDDPAEAATAAHDADIALVVVGYTAADEGEYLGQEGLQDPAILAMLPPPPPGVDMATLMQSGEYSANVMGSADGGDRESLRLRPSDVELIRVTAAANPRTVVVLVTAGAVITEEWRDLVPAVVVGWYNGSEGGHGLADVLLGKADATGRLPYSIPTDESHLPFFDREATEIIYDRWHGQRLLDREGVRAAFPLGFGLSYTTFTLSNLEVGPVESESFTATVDVANTGGRRGRHVVQLYATLDGVEDFPHRVLVGFEPIWVDPGETAQVRITGSIRPLQQWTTDGFVPAAPAVTVEAAAYSGDPDALTAPLRLTS